MPPSLTTIWVEWMWPAFWQSAILFAFVMLVDAVGRKWLWPQARLMLWLLIPLKLIVPPTLVSPVSVTASLSDGVLREVGLLWPFLALLFHGPAAPGVLESQRYPAWAALLAIVWIAGVFILATGYALRLVHLRNRFLEDYERLPQPDWLAAEVACAASQVGLRRPPQAVVTGRVWCPAVFGLFRPLVFIPRDLIDRLSREDLRNVLLHELAHVRRGDLWLQAGLIAVQILYWFNPLVYLANRRISELRELCCDATVAFTLRELTVHYRRTLLRVAEQLAASRGNRLDEAISLFERNGSLADRLDSLGNLGWRYHRRRFAVTALAALILIVSVVPMGSHVHRCPRVPMVQMQQ